MRLTSTGLEFLLGGAVTTNQLHATAAWDDLATTATTSGENDVDSNGATPVTLIAAPTAGTARIPKGISIHNRDTAAATVTVRKITGSRIVCKATLAVGDTLHYEDGRGWYILDVDGKIKTSGGGGGTSLTVEEVDGTPSVTSVVKIKFAQADGLTVTDETGGVARINVSAAAAPDDEARILAHFFGG